MTYGQIRSALNWMSAQCMIETRATGAA
jgi:hypothetical protein